MNISHRFWQIALLSAICWRCRFCWDVWLHFLIFPCIARSTGIRQWILFSFLWNWEAKHWQVTSGYISQVSDSRYWLLLRLIWQQIEDKWWLIWPVHIINCSAMGRSKAYSKYDKGHKIYPCLNTKYGTKIQSHTQTWTHTNIYTYYVTLFWHVKKKWRMLCNYQSGIMISVMWKLWEVIRVNMQAYSYMHTNHNSAPVIRMLSAFLYIIDK